MSKSIEIKDEIHSFIENIIQIGTIVYYVEHEYCPYITPSVDEYYVKPIKFETGMFEKLGDDIFITEDEANKSVEYLNSDEYKHCNDEFMANYWENVEKMVALIKKNRENDENAVE